MVGKQLVEYIIQKMGQVVNNKFGVRDNKIANLEEENELLRQDIAGLPTDTATGENIDVTDSAEVRFEKLDVGGNSKQNTTEGKNKYSITESTSTATQYANMLYGGEQLKTNTQYTIKVKGKPGDKYRTTTGDYGICTTSDVFTIGNDGIGTVTFTTKESYEGLSTFGILNNYSANNTLPLTEITIAEGTEPTYEPYTNGASPNPEYEQPIHSVGDNVNLFDKDNANIINSYFDNNAQEISSSNDIFRTIYLKCNPNYTYTVSKVKSSRFSVGCTDVIPAPGVTVNNVVTSNSATSITVTTNSTANYIVVFVRHNSYDTIDLQEILDSIKIEKRYSSNKI